VLDTYNIKQRLDNTRGCFRGCDCMEFVFTSINYRNVSCNDTRYRIDNIIAKYEFVIYMYKHV